jgi:hypothetical protein
MKMQIIPRGQAVPHSTMEADISGEVFLSKVFEGVIITTEENQRFGVCQRDSGLEVNCPDGAMVEIKFDEAGEVYVVSHTASRPRWAGEKDD